MSVWATRQVVYLAPVCLLAGVLCVGCAGRTDKEAWMRYADRLEPAVGKAGADEFIREWGSPHDETQLEDGCVYHWHFSKGRRSVGFSYFLSLRETYEAYDDVLLIFDNDGILREWKAECIR